MKATVSNGISFDDSDVVNLDDWIPAGESNPHKVRPFLFHDHGFTLAVVFATCLQDALDIAADAEKLDRFKIGDTERGDYAEDDDRISYLGNDGSPHDIESLVVVEMSNPKRSFAAQYAAHFGEPNG